MLHPNRCQGEQLEGKRRMANEKKRGEGEEKVHVKMRTAKGERLNKFFS